MAAASPDQTFKKGFPKEIINDGNVDPKYLCALCELVLRIPIQSFCGHRFCDSCIKNKLLTAGDEKITCPSCEKEEMENEYSDLKKTFPDNAIKREFANMNAKCVSPGCTWSGSFKVYVVHESECEYQLIDCECGKQVPKHQFETHRESECSHRVLVCPYCNSNVLAKDLETHNKECSMFPVQCQGCRREGFTRAELAKHQDKEVGDCEARAKICPLNCGRTVEGDLKAHINAEPGDHIVALTEKVFLMEKKVKRMANDGQIVSDAVPIPSSAKSTDVERLFRKVTEIEQQLGQPQTPGAPAEKGGATGGGAVGGRALGGGIPGQGGPRGRPDGDDINVRVSMTDNKVNQFEDALAIITQQLESFREEAEQAAAQNRELKTMVQTLERRAKQLEKGMQLKDLSIAELDLKLQAMDQTVYDGTMTWKISDFAKKRQDAISGQMTSIYSSPFFTSRTGYKMCARLYLNGDGMGKGTHVSLFFVVMKGTYDALLKWPFRQRVTLMLLDQNHHEHVVEAFRPDPNSSSFRRPTSDMNIASGCPLFCTLAQIDQAVPAYVKDDTMFIRIVVDTADL